jgi:transposase InsO family protein
MDFPPLVIVYHKRTKSPIHAEPKHLIHWELRETMTEKDVEIILQRAREKFPQASPRIISDNGPQFIAKDFKEYIRLVGMTHVRTSPFYPQSNGKLERYHKTIKAECIRPKVALSLEEARTQIADYIPALQR